MNQDMKKEMKNIKVTPDRLQPGQVINPPQAERCWLWKDGVKRRYTVIKTELGKKTKRGQYIRIHASVHLDEARPEWGLSCEMLETKQVIVYS